MSLRRYWRFWCRWLTWWWDEPNFILHRMNGTPAFAYRIIYERWLLSEPKLR